MAASQRGCDFEAIVAAIEIPDRLGGWEGINVMARAVNEILLPFSVGAAAPPWHDLVGLTAGQLNFFLAAVFVKPIYQ